MTREYLCLARCPCCRQPIRIRGPVEHGELVTARVPRHRDDIGQTCPLSAKPRRIPVDDLISWRRDS
jgi:hypothetical protein